MRVGRRWKIGSLSWREEEGRGWRVLCPPVVPRGRPVHQQWDVTQCSGGGGAREEKGEGGGGAGEEGGGGGGGGEEEEAGLHATASAPAPPYPVSRHPQKYSANSNSAFNGGEMFVQCQK